ncbi:hypothetical protein CTI12_AA607070 [Artemisia annua]|uniref:Reverse transcriptase zinc-binding domain-containing protein n=1 Tax=Artemisia annua TaxID=35608 RepID=A0A2U1KFX9_ARTAN|nr:hypothetical protein CTI12_AA607070 [Artemisia annua]
MGMARHLSGHKEGELSNLINCFDRHVLDASKAVSECGPWTILTVLIRSFSQFIQHKLLYNDDAMPYFLCNCRVPHKVNVCAWRLSLDGLPTRANLICRGNSLPSANCLFCGLEEESRDHCFVSCPRIKIIWLKIWSW